MGTTTSSAAASGSSGAVINLSSGSKIQAYLPTPPKQTRGVGIVFLVDPKLGFGSQSARGLAEELSAQSEFLVLCPDLTMYREPEDASMTAKQVADMIKEAQVEVKDTVDQLKTHGAVHIGVLGFGKAADFAITCTVESGLFLASCTFCGDVNIGSLSRVESPVLVVLAGKDECVPTSRAAAISSAITSLGLSGVPARVKVFQDQASSFVEAESPATEAAVEELCKFFSEHLDIPSPEEWRTESFLKRPPVEEDWWGKEGEFNSIGLTNWEVVRARWKKHQIPQRPPKPPLVLYEAVVQGFANPRRTFELPGRMSLQNMVSVLVDIWDVEGVS